MVFVLLTLDKHKEGIWVTKLVHALHDVCPQKQVRVVPIETFFDAAPSVDNIFPHMTTGIINRVSDAADPVAFKLAVTLLKAARHCGIPIFNGPEAYTLCANKFCHHVLFQRAGVATPPSRIITANSDPGNLLDCITTTNEVEDLRYPLLLKPNAGGFGAGIHRLDDESSSDALMTRDKLATPDGIRIVQNYIRPSDGYIYRVWFLNGRVQCAVKRSVQEDNPNDLTTGCAGGSVCQRRPTPTHRSPSFTACSVPPNIHKDVTQIIAQLADAHAGSIEYLYDDSERPLYFDLNLLSTLPLVSTVELAGQIWGSEYDPWQELACTIHDICQSSSEKNHFSTSP